MVWLTLTSLCMNKEMNTLFLLNGFPMKLLAKSMTGYANQKRPFHGRSILHVRTERGIGGNHRHRGM